MLLNAILDFVLVFEVFLAITTLRFQGNTRKNTMAIEAVSTTEADKQTLQSWTKIQNPRRTSSSSLYS